MARVRTVRHGQGLLEGHSLWNRQVGGISQSWGPTPARNYLMLVNTVLQQLPRGGHVLPPAELAEPYTQVFPVVEA